jgi:hypothetical protein
MDARGLRRLGIIMLIHAAVFGVINLKRGLGVGNLLPVGFLIAGAVLMRKSREAARPQEPR